MKRTILFALIAVMFLAMFTGCRAYRRNHTIAAPRHEVTHRDNRTAHHGFHYRTDGRVTHPTQNHAHGFRHDGRVTDTDGIIGNGTHADRPVAYHGYRASNAVGESPYGIGGTRGMDGVRNAGMTGTTGISTTR